MFRGIYGAEGTDIFVRQGSPVYGMKTLVLYHRHLVCEDDFK